MKVIEFNCGDCVHYSDKGLCKHRNSTDLCADRDSHHKCNHVEDFELKPNKTKEKKTKCK